MNNINILTKLYYIVDSNGHFFRLSDDGQLVAAKEKSDAGLFSYEDANQHGLLQHQRTNHICVYPLL